MLQAVHADWLTKFLCGKVPVYANICLIYKKSLLENLCCIYNNIIVCKKCMHNYSK